MDEKNKDVAQRILQAAIKAFDKYGLRKTTMRDIAESAGMSKSSLYYYFRDKKKILSSVIRQEAKTLIGKLSMAVQKAASPQDKLRAYVITRMRLLFQLSIYYASLTEAYLEQYAFIEQEREAFTDFENTSIQNILSEGINTGVFRITEVFTTAKMIIIIMKGMELRLIIGKSMDDLDETVSTMLDILLQGLETR
ncbi:TetR/AcrR family transcriptional regulator [Candidatus Fermentibacteria bacterium]|nr:MAG: TetR/AcrR family transcriptional regulator [Candidatus Fermentibacteria bacterium]